MPPGTVVLLRNIKWACTQAPKTQVASEAQLGEMLLHEAGQTEPVH
jgi:hypothetical protein